MLQHFFSMSEYWLINMWFSVTNLSTQYWTFSYIVGLKLIFKQTNWHSLFVLYVIVLVHVSAAYPTGAQRKRQLGSQVDHSLNSSWWNIPESLEWAREEEEEEEMGGITALWLLDEGEKRVCVMGVGMGNWYQGKKNSLLKHLTASCNS